ncbi:MAG: 3'-5' exoribonuclease [Muribaculaceae bacterium]|nr:3'-5' exoribonuclease [Muribaculaceae bacterium]
MRILKDFCAIDFETMTPKRTSACSIGMAKVRDGKIVETFHSLIKPVPDDSNRTNTFVHGITHEMVEDAPTFDKIWDRVQSLIEEFPLVAHNSEFDKSVFSNLLNHYNLANPDFFEFQCTYKLTGLKLELACQAYDIDTETHHNAEKDAVMCAKVYLKVSEKDPDKFFLCDFFEEPTKKSKRSLDKKALNKIEDSEISNKNTPFYNQKIVITGVFLNYPDRNELAQTLQNYGASVVGSISSKTNIVIVGADAGPSKLRKIDDFNAKGANIRIIREKELKEILDKADSESVVLDTNSKQNEQPQEDKEEWTPESFEGKKVVVGGNFNSFESVEDIITLLAMMGNPASKRFSKDTKIALLAYDFPDSFDDKLIEYGSGGRIKIMWEKEFVDYLLKYHPEFVNVNKKY